MRWIAKHTLVAILVGGSIGGAAAQPSDLNPVDLLIDACQAQGENPSILRSGYAEFELLVTDRPPSEAAIQAEIDSQVKGLRQALENAANPKARAIYERNIKEVPDLVRARRATARRSRIKELFGGNEFAGNKRFEVTNFDAATKKWGRPVINLRRNANKEGGENVLWDDEAQTALFTDQNVAVFDFQPIGRIQGFPAKVVTSALLGGSDPKRFEFPPKAVKEFKDALSKASQPAQAGSILLSLGEEMEYDGGAVAIEVASSLKIGQSPPAVRQRYWIDPSRGHVCPRIAIYSDTGTLEAEWQSRDYFLHSKSGLWFPAQHVYTEYVPGTTTIRERREYRFEPKTFQLNQEISDEEFAIDIPAGARVQDVRAGKDLGYRATEAFTLSFAKGGLDLGSKPLHPTGNPPKTVWPWRAILIAGNLVVLIVAAILVWRRRWQRVVAVLVCTCVLSSGCSRLGQGQGEGHRTIDG